MSGPLEGVREGAKRILGLSAAQVLSANRWSPALKVQQRSLVSQWRAAIAAGASPDLASTGFRVFSQFEEDGLLLFVMTAIGEGTRTFVDLGSADGINSNCANLAVNHGWDGLFIDGNSELVERGRTFYEKHPDTWAWPPRLVCALLTRESVNELIADAGFGGEVDLVSIDVDGNDYWLWHALEVVEPRVVIIETNVGFGTRNVVFPYDPDHIHPGRHEKYHGASVAALAALASQLGYRLVGANAYGFNTIWIRGDVASDLLPEVPPSSVLSHPRNRREAALCEPIASWDYVEGGTGFPGTPAPPSAADTQGPGAA